MIDRADPLVGVVLNGKYRLDIRIASGGFGAIYQASDVESGVELAVKVVHARLASDRGIVARFQREGEALTALRSPHTITAYELGETDEGVLYIAMELLRGVNLYERFREDGPLSWRRVAAIALGVCDSLAEAHALGIVHRDLKPTNIHLEPRGEGGEFVKVLDFGIAKILQHSQFHNDDLTNAGLMIGTIDYMSPEQMVGGDISGASDLYTLGIVMYEMIAGKRPFPELPTPASVLAAMLKPPPPLASKAIVPAELDRIVMRCLERDPEHRYQRAEDLAADLRRLLEAGDARPRSFDPDDDATQVATRAISATIMATAAPPPPSSSPSSSPAIPLPPPPPAPRPLPGTPRPLPGTPRATTAPLTVTPRRSSPPPVPAPAAAPAEEPEMPMRLLPTPPPRSRQVTPPPPPPIGSSAAPPPLTPVNTLRGLAIPNTGRDSGQLAEASVAEPPAPRRRFDPARIAQRDAMVRNLLWICVLVIASVIGAVLAIRL